MMEIRNAMIFESKKLQPLLASFCAFGWSLAYPLIKLGYSEIGIGGGDTGSKIMFAGIRFFAAGLMVTLVSALQKRNMKINRRETWTLIVFGLVNTALHYMFAYIGLSYIPSSRSTILDSMGGFLLIILSCIFFEDDTFNCRKLIGCLLGFSGVVIINIVPADTFFANISFRGDGMILLNACCAAAGGIITKLISKKMDMMVATGYSMSIGGAMLILAGTGTAAVTGRPCSIHISLKGMGIVFLLILISAVCFSVYNMLLAYHPISKVAIYNALIPILGVMFSCILLKEPFMWQYILAGAIVAAGIYVINKK